MVALSIWLAIWCQVTSLYPELFLDCFDPLCTVVCQFMQWLCAQVLIRTRPMSSTEVASQGFSRCLKQESPHTITWVGPPESRFTFDHVAGEIVTQV